MPFKSNNAMIDYFYLKGNIMVFISQNKIRKCKYCDNPPKVNMSSGRNKGYYKTCGSEVCLRKQYDDKFVNEAKRRLNNPKDLVCICCGEEFIAIYSNHKRYCLACVPDKSWRNRARHYLVGKKKWDELLQKQNNTCVLCDRNPEVVDHCHKSGEVRGLLCGACNTQIAKMDFDRQWLKKALTYIGEENAIC